MSQRIDSGSTSRIRNCSWGYKCEKIWEGLIATDSKSVRFCDACEKEVYLCKTKRELADSVLLNRCVAFPPALLDSKGSTPNRRSSSRKATDLEIDDHLFPVSIGEVITRITPQEPKDLEE